MSTTTLKLLNFWSATKDGTALERQLARLAQEVGSAALDMETLAEITGRHVGEVRCWFNLKAGDIPNAIDYAALSEHTQIDLAYVMTGRREVRRG